ncbi:MAG: threonylcarbamoyl-AMP synthase [Bdellovibrionaceae bacterium]|nr:threonylcarbamoyl-AMP synthase [Pseudobdellovibrionaceae bacterium]
MKSALIDLKTALQVLSKDGVVGLPTETVYGLAARIDRPLGIQSIFSTKERPFFDPLIVHVASFNQARSLTTEWSKAAALLAEKFWPGPLTLVLPKASTVNPLITSGLESVGLRMPKHPLALQLIALADCPLAAPSANKFGRTSPTSAAHVISEFQGLVPVIEGGPCDVGIESTVLRLQEKKGVTILNLLRPGAVTLTDLSMVLDQAGISYRIEEAVEKSVAPGQMKHHYMPDIPLIWVETKLGKSEITARTNRRLKELPDVVEGVKIKKPSGALSKSAELVLSEDPAIAARELYALLREKAASGADHLIYRHDPKKTGPEWLGLLDRLRKAAHFILD